MSDKEFIELGSRKIRNNENLMAFYLDLFYQYFGRKPNCAGCSFSGDFKRLKRKILSNKPKKSIKMRKKKKGTYVLKKKYYGKILSYKNSEGRIIRRYGVDIDDEFAENFLKSNFGKLTKKEKQEMFEVQKKEVSPENGQKDAESEGSNESKGDTPKDDKDAVNEPGNGKSGEGASNEDHKKEVQKPEFPKPEKQPKKQEKKKKKNSKKK